MEIIEKAPAKINLTLDVLYKRTDNFHEVEMIMTTIDLADYLYFTPISENEIILDSNSGRIPLDEKNLAYKAVKLIKDKFAINQGVKIFIDKKIPIAAGLAGGSSDAAAVIRGLNRLWSLNLTIEEMRELGALIGSDIPFCIKGGTALAKGRGEIIESLPSIPFGWVVLAKKPISVSTASVYGALDVSTIKKHPETNKMIKAISNKNMEEIINHLENVLEPVTLELYPEVAKLKGKMEQFFGKGVLMSGSGPTIYALTEHEKKAKRLYQALKGFCHEVYITRLLV